MYPDTIDLLHPGFASQREVNVAINQLQNRVGTFRDDNPASIEDRLFTMEMLMLHVLQRLDMPPGQGKK